MFKVLIRLFTALMICCVAGCGGGGGTQPDPNPNPNPLPSGSDPVVKDNVVVMEEQAGLAFESSTSSSLTFRNNTTVAPDVTPGEYLVGQEDGGYLRRVESVSWQDDEVYIKTSPAQLTDVLERGSLESQLTFSKSSSTSSDDLPAHTISQLGSISVDLSDTNLYQDEYISVDLTNGVVQFDPTINIICELDWSQIKYFKTSVEGHLSFNFDVEATSEIQRDFAEETKVFERTETFVQLIGVVPVVEVVTLRLFAGVEGAGMLEGRAGAGFDSTTTVEIGAQYRNNTWSPVNEFGHNFHEHDPFIEVEGEFGMRAYVRPELEVLFYNTAGPTIDAEPYLAFDAEGVLVPYVDIDWWLNAGLTSDVDFDVNILGSNLGHWNQRIIEFEQEIAAGNISFGDPLDPPSITGVSPLTPGVGEAFILSANNTGGAASSWQWDLGSGAQPESSSDPAPMVEYAAAGTYQCSVTASNVAGEDTFAFSIYVDDIETYTVSGQVTSEGDGLADVILALEPGGRSDQTDADGYFQISGVPNGEYALTPSMAGYSFTPPSESVEVLYADETGFSFSATPDVSAPNIVDVTPKGGLEHTQDARFDAVNIGGAADEYRWDFGGGATPDAPVTNVPYVYVELAGVGIYDASVEAANQAGSSTLPFTLQIDDVIWPPENVEINVNPAGPWAPGASVTFSASVDGTPPFDYSWDFDGGASPNTSQSASVLVTMGASGDYTASVNVANSAGSDSDADSYSIIELPVAVLSADNTTGQAALPVDFDGSESYDPNDYTLDRYELNFYYNLNPNDWQDYTDTQGRVEYPYGNSGTHIAALRVRNTQGAWSVPDTVEIIVYPPPQCYPPVWGEFEVGDSSVTLWWTPRPPEENVSNYWVELYWQASGGEAVFQRNIPSGDADRTYIPDLDPETDYWAAIRSGNGDWSDWGPRKHFYTALPHIEWSSQVVDSNRDGAISAIIMADGRPLIAYADSANDDVYVVRGNDSMGSSWGTPIPVDTAGEVGGGLSMAIIGGNPALSYCEASGDDLKYVRATNTSGTSWGAPVTVDTAGNIDFTTSLKEVNGRPAIAYNVSTPDYDLRYVRATNTTGSSWGTPVNVVTADDVRMELSMVVAGGNPAIAYYDFADATLNYIRATDSSGSSWGSIQVVDSNYGSGRYLSMAIVAGNPAIAYHETYTPGTDKTIRFVRATDTSGSSWGTKYLVHDIDDSREYMLAVVNGKPAVAFFDFTNKNAMFVWATDSTGTSWNPAEAVDAAGFVGWNPSLADIGGSPAMAYKHTDDSDLKFAIKN